MVIHNYINRLPKGKGSWGKRSLSDIDYIVLHQALGMNATAEGVNAYHIASSAKGIDYGRSWPRIAYHFFIERDGTIKQCNTLESIVWHAKGANTNGIGICVSGNFEGQGHTKGNPLPSYKFNEPTEQQLEALEFLVGTLLHQLDLDPAHAVKGHSDFGKPACPGFALENWMEQFIISFDDENELYYDHENQICMQEPMTDERDG